MRAASNAPAIIKRKKVVSGDGHHGGAWKVAYADFVTAMMAFFMLMWLLNATTEKQRKGIADYFNPTIPINRISGGGEGSFGGDSVFSENVMAQNGTGATSRHATSQRQARGQSGVDAVGRDPDPAKQDLAKVEKALMARGGESMATENAMRHIVTRVTDEGLIVELFDTEGSPLFDPETDTPTPLLEDLAALVAGVFSLVQNGVAIGGHLRAQPIVLRDDPGWDLSARRAQAMRKLFETSGFPAERVQRVTGYAARQPVTRDPMAARNNRLELVLLRSDIEAAESRKF